MYEETASGKSAERPELAHCLKALREDAILVVWRLDRLGRNLKDLVQIVTDLEARGVKFKSLTDSIDTSGPAGKIVFHMLAALAQFERELLRKQKLAGLAAARARSRKDGRPPLLNANKQRIALSMMKNREMSMVAIAEHLGVSRSTLYNLQKSRSLVVSRDWRSLLTAVPQRAVKVTRQSTALLGCVRIQKKFLLGHFFISCYTFFSAACNEKQVAGMIWKK